MPIQCTVNLENPLGIYQAGDSINGQVVLVINERELIKGLGVEINGYAATAWVKPIKVKKQKNTTSADVVVLPNGTLKTAKRYEHRVDYLSTINYFIGSEAALPKIIERGVYKYNFSTRLPEKCPSSYEGEHGHIRYVVKVFLDTVDSRVIAHSSTLNVICGRDLREQADSLTRACELQRQEQTSRMKFWQRALQLEIDIPRQGYAPGEGISVHVKVHNPQHLTLTELIYKINLIATHIGMHKRKRRETKLECRNLVTSVHGLTQLGREARANVLQHLQTLQVPQTPPTLTATECQCLQLSYELEVIVHTTQRKRCVCAQLPIIIGSKSLEMPSAPPLQAITSDCGFLYTTRSCLDLTAGVSPPELAPQATAPPLTPTLENSQQFTPSLSVSMCNLSTNLREAEYKINNSRNNPKFRPKYVFYEMEQTDAERSF